MKSFSYEARNKSTSKIVKASVQASSETEAAKLLIDQGFIPINIKEQEDNSNLLSKISGRITTKDKIVFTRQLATLVGAGLPLAQCLNTVLDQTQNKKLQSLIQDVVVSVEGGKSLSMSFAKYPKVFDKVFLSLVGAGETSGTLVESLQRIADQQEKDAAVVGKIKGAMIYPVIVLLVIVGVLMFMMFTVVPQVENLYKDLNRELPMLTKVLVSIMHFVGAYWWVALTALALAFYFLFQFIRTEAGKRAIDKIKLNIPFFGKMYGKLYMARFTRNGQTLLASGVSMLDMIRLTAASVNNCWIEDALLKAADKVKGGKALSVALKDQEYILPIVPQMISVGEESGKIDEMLGKTAQVFEDDLDGQIRAISTSIEPILMIVLAVAAGIMVAAILLPIYSMVGSINI